MFFSRMSAFLKHLDFISLSVPLAVVAASIFLPPQSVFQQALVGIMLIWCYVQFLTGFPFWR